MRVQFGRLVVCAVVGLGSTGALVFGLVRDSYGAGCTPDSLHEQCLKVSDPNTEARAAFCRSLKKPISDRCWNHINDSKVSWTGWCNNEFTD
jgi:hypothetical protein